MRLSFPRNHLRVVTGFDPQVRYNRKVNWEQGGIEKRIRTLAPPRNGSGTGVKRDAREPGLMDARFEVVAAAFPREAFLERH